MKPKGLLVAVAVLAVLGGLVWWSNKKQAAAGKSSTDATTKILSIPDDQFQEIRIKKLTGEVQDLHRVNGKWQLTQPNQLSADPDTVGSMVSSLSSLNADKVIEDKAADLQPYGLHVPTLDITVVKKDGKSDELLIGDDTPTGSGAYAKLAADPRVFTVASYTKSSLDKTPSDLRDKRLLTFDSDKLTRVDLQAKGQPVEFGKNNRNEWQILKPRPLRADGSQVETLINKLKDAKMDLSGAQEDIPKKFAAAPKVATAVVADAGGNQTLEVRRDKDKNCYAKSSAVEGTYKVASDLADALDKNLDDFRNKKLFDFGFSDPSKVELKTATYAKSGDKWLAGSKTLDNTSVQNLIDKLRDLSATKFPEKGGGEPVFEARVTSGDGKRVEKISITKQGNQYFAQRENEPSIYELDSQAVTDLQKAASDVKEQAPPQPKKK
ncbi:MAG: DUF4340 domain-containing protein [Bryobacteraceae bacterium]|jgi:hypothetical protein